MKVIVDLGFGEEAEIVVQDGATFKEIKNQCLKQTGKPLFCIKHKGVMEKITPKEW